MFLVLACLHLIVTLAYVQNLIDKEYTVVDPTPALLSLQIAS